MDRRYWDSDCFLGWLQAEPDKEAFCRQVLEEAEAGKILIVTSALTVAEVLALRGRPRVPPANRTQVEKFFRQPYIDVRSVTRRISETARDLVWDQGIDPKDAIHVATAIDAKLPLMNTFDDKLQKRTGRVGNPKLIIEAPALLQPRLNLAMPSEVDDYA